MLQCSSLILPQALREKAAASLVVPNHATNRTAAPRIKWLISVRIKVVPDPANSILAPRIQHSSQGNAARCKPNGNSATNGNGGTAQPEQHHIGRRYRPSLLALLRLVIAGS